MTKTPMQAWLDSLPLGAMRSGPLPELLEEDDDE